MQRLSFILHLHSKTVARNHCLPPLAPFSNCALHVFVHNGQGAVTSRSGLGFVLTSQMLSKTQHGDGLPSSRSDGLKCEAMKLSAGILCMKKAPLLGMPPLNKQRDAAGSQVRSMDEVPALKFRSARGRTSWCTFLDIRSECARQLRRTNNKFHVLITDWREAPCCSSLISNQICAFARQSRAFMQSGRAPGLLSFRVGLHFNNTFKLVLSLFCCLRSFQSGRQLAVRSCKRDKGKRVC